jgi:hypothetical protein
MGDGDGQIAPVLAVVHGGNVRAAAVLVATVWR